MQRAIAALRKRITRRNAVWFLRVNVAGWVIQGAIFGALILAGVGSLHAMVSAKVTNWVVFIGQCYTAGR